MVRVQRVRLLFALLFVAISANSIFAQCVSLTTLGSASTQNFDTLSNTAGSTTNNLTITGWFLTESGGGARDNEQYAVDTGGSGTGDMYSYGAAASTERALGELRSGTLIPLFGSCYTNNTGGTITSLDVAYTGEQWRLGTTARTDQINFEYSTNATDLVTGAWTGVAALNFVSPDTGTTGVKNGNSAGNRTALSNTIGSLSIANGATFWIRWTDTDASGADDGLSVDDFSLTPNGGPVAPTLSINDVSQLETNAGTTTFLFTVSLTAPAGPGGVTFDIATADNTATLADSDYVLNSLTGQNIPSGSSTYAFSVTVNGDTAIESNETFFVNVTNVVGATPGDAQGQGTIQNDDSPPNLTIADIAQPEGNASTATMTFTVQLSSPAPPSGVTFDIATADNTATTADGDYVANSTLGVTIPAGNSSATFDVTINGDTLFEGNDTFFVNVTNVTGANVTDGQATGTINNDDTAPAISINDVGIVEGNAGTQTLTFTVALSVPAAGPITVDYATADSSATDADNDYEIASNTLTFIPSDVSETFTVTINGDTNVEGDEQFFVNLTNATGGATISDNQGLGVIKLDDAFSIAAVDTAYTQNFDVLSNSALAATTPAAWTSLETGSAANLTYNFNDGASNAGNTYSYGTTATTDRAFGALQSGSLIPTIGVFYRNDTGVTITTLSIQYKGEEWRLGTASRQDRLDFQYSTDATSLSTGTWTDVDNLDFSTPNTASTGAKNGNGAGNFTNVNFTIAGLSIAPGTPIWIRFNDLNASGSDDGLAIDDFSIIANIAGGVLTVDDQLLLEGDAGTQVMAFTVSLTQPAGVSGVTFDITTADNTATVADNDYVANSVIGATIPSGQSTYSFPVTINGDTNSEVTETFFVNISNVTGVSPSDLQGVGTIGADDFTYTLIHDIQGNGNTSPLSGNTVTVGGIVTGIKGGGSGGFFVQEEDAQADADPNTSEGIFIFTSGAIPPGVAIGNQVAVTGTVSEFPGSAAPHTHTELAGTISASLLATAQPLPTAAVITPADGAPSSNISQYERFEGMRVSVPSLTVVAPTQGSVDEVNATSTSNGVFFGVVTGVARPFREIGIEQTAIIPAEAPCPACIDRWDMNPEKLRVDSDGQPGATQLNVAAGQTVTNVIGVLDFGFFEYTILPEAATVPVVTGDDTFDAVPTPLATELTVAGYNLERFFDTVDEPAISDAILTPVAFNKRLAKASLAIRNVLKTPDVVGAVEVENLTALQALATQLNTDTAGATNYVAYLVEGNDVGGIDVGFLVNANRVTVNSVTQFGKTTTFVDPSDSSVDLLNDRPPLLLEGSITRPDLSLFNFTVIVNHLRSLNGVDTDDASGQRIRAKRGYQAEYLADLVQTRLTSNPAENILLVGDFNAFEFHDGYVDLIGTIKGSPAPATEVVRATADLLDPDLTDLIETLPANARYTYSFDGSAQSIDHALVNTVLLPRVSRFAVGHVDADFPDSFRGDGSRPERISDHDGTVTYINLGATADLAVTKTDSPDPVIAGSNLTYTITVTNNGPDAAATAAWSDLLPTGTTFVSLSSPGGWSCTTPAVGSGGTVSCSNASQAVGGAVFTLTVAVDPSVVAGTVLTNTATATTTSTDGTAGNNSGVATTTVAASADLSVTKVDTPDPVTAGTNLTYTITLNNAGPSNAASVSLSDTLPAGTTFVSLASPGGWSCTTPAVGAGGTVSCSIATLGLGNAVFTLTVAVDPSTATGTVISNTATASSTTSDPNSGNESSTATTTVGVGSADLSVTNTDSPDPVVAGTNLTYTINVTNAGPTTATTASPSVPIPASTSFQSLSAPAGWSCTTPAVGGTGTVSCSNASFGVTTAAFTLVVNVDASTLPGAVITSTATVSSATTDPTPGNETATATTTVISPANVTGSKTISGQLYPGGAVTYTIVLSNTGAGAQADNAGNEFVDVLPSELELVSAAATSGTAVATIATNTVTWNGSIPQGGSVTITIDAIIQSVPVGTIVTNQGTVFYDVDGNGSNEASAPTDSPTQGGSADATAFTVVANAGAMATVPALDGFGLFALAALLSVLGAVFLRRS